jgi:hypothetical protein
MQSKTAKQGRRRPGRRRANEQRRPGYQLAPQAIYSVVNQPRGTSALAPHQYCFLHYMETINFSTATATGTQNLFNLNSLFDPNRTGGGVQPYQYDDLTPMFGRYRVYETEWRIEVTSSIAIHTVCGPCDGLLPSAIAD